MYRRCFEGNFSYLHTGGVCAKSIRLYYKALYVVEQTPCTSFHISGLEIDMPKNYTTDKSKSLY